MMRAVMPDGAVGQFGGGGPGTRLPPRRWAGLSLLLLLAINLFNYVDRQVLSAVEPDIRRDILHEPLDKGGLMDQGGHGARGKSRTGWLASAFLVSFMLGAPVFGWLADRMSRWVLVGTGVMLWSAASFASGLAGTFGALLITRLFIGIGEAAYGPAAPTIIADLYPPQWRGSVMAWFYMAIPVGSALGYVLAAGLVPHFTPNWRWAFYSVMPPGLLLGVICFFMVDPPRRAGHGLSTAPLADYLRIIRIPSYLLNTVGMSAMTFGIYGISFFMPGYLHDRRAAADPNRATYVFGCLQLAAGVSAPLLGGLIGDLLQRRFGAAYLVLSAGSIFLSAGCIVLMLLSPFPQAWVWLFLAAFFIFFVSGPVNTVLANVVPVALRTKAFGLNIFLIYFLGALPAPPLIGLLVDRGGRWDRAFYLVCATMVLGGVLWLCGARYLAADTERARKSGLSDGVGF